MTVLGLDSNGLGSPRRVLSAEQVLRFQKYFYSNSILYVLNLGLSEISILLLIRNLTPVKTQKTAMLVIITFTALWAVASVFTLLFQCHPPHVWQFINNKCINRVVVSRLHCIDYTLIKPKEFILDNLYCCSCNHRAFVDCIIRGIDLGPQTIEGNQSTGDSSIHTSYSVSRYSCTSPLLSKNLKVNRSQTIKVFSYQPSHSLHIFYLQLSRSTQHLICGRLSSARRSHSRSTSSRLVSSK